MLRVAGPNELRLLIVIMVTAGVLSAFMNNVGVAALLLPVVMDIARRTRLAPSKLLIPLAFGALLGGLTTLIGTPPNAICATTTMVWRRARYSNSRVWMPGKSKLRPLASS